MIEKTCHLTMYVFPWITLIVECEQQNEKPLNISAWIWKIYKKYPAFPQRQLG